MVSKWLITIYNLLIPGVYRGFITHLLCYAFTSFLEHQSIKASQSCRLGRLPSAPWPNQTDFLSYSVDQAVHRSGSEGNFGGENVQLINFKMVVF